MSSIKYKVSISGHYSWNYINDTYIHVIGIFIINSQYETLCTMHVTETVKGYLIVLCSPNI